MFLLHLFLFWNCTNWGYLGDPLAGVSEGLGVETRETLDRRSRTWACLRGGVGFLQIAGPEGGSLFSVFAGGQF